MEATEVSEATIKAARNKANTAFKALVQAMANKSADPAPLLGPAVTAMRDLKNLQAAAPAVAAQVFGAAPAKTPEAAAVNIFANLKKRATTNQGVLNAATYIAAVRDDSTQIAKNRKIGRGFLGGYKNKSVAAFWKAVNAEMAKKKTNASSKAAAIKQAAIQDFKRRLKKSNGAYNVKTYLNSTTNNEQKANRLIGRSTAMFGRKYPDENLRKFWANVNIELKTRGKVPPPNTGDAGAAKNNGKIKKALAVAARYAGSKAARGATAAATFVTAGKTPYSTAFNKQSKVNIMANYLATKGISNLRKMVDAWAEQSGQVNKNALFTVKLEAFKKALEAPNNKTTRIILQTQPLGEKTNATIVINALLKGKSVPPEPKAVRLAQEKLNFFKTKNGQELINAVLNEYRSLDKNPGLTPQNIARSAKPKLLNNALQRQTPRFARLAAGLGFQKENWTLNTFQKALSAAYLPAAGAVAGPPQPSKVNKLMNAKWFTNYPGNTTLQADAYLATNPSPNTFKNDVNTMASSGNKGLMKVRNYLITDNTNGIYNPTRKANIERRRGEYAKLTAAANAAATSRAQAINNDYTSLQMKVGTKTFNKENRKILESLAKGRKPNGKTIVTGLNLTNMNNRIAALASILPGLTMSQGTFGNINKKTNINTNSRALLKAYMEKYTKSSGLGFRGNRAVNNKARRIINKNRAMAIYTKQLSGSEGSANQQAILQRLLIAYPNTVFNWSTARNNISRNTTLTSKYLTLLNSLPGGNVGQSATKKRANAAAAIKKWKNEMNSIIRRYDWGSVRTHLNGAKTAGVTNDVVTVYKQRLAQLAKEKFDQDYKQFMKVKTYATIGSLETIIGRLKSYKDLLDMSSNSNKIKADYTGKLEIVEKIKNLGPQINNKKYPELAKKDGQFKAVYNKVKTNWNKQNFTNTEATQLVTNVTGLATTYSTQKNIVNKQEKIRKFVKTIWPLTVGRGTPWTPNKSNNAVGPLLAKINKNGLVATNKNNIKANIRAASSPATRAIGYGPFGGANKNIQQRVERANALVNMAFP